MRKITYTIPLIALMLAGCNSSTTTNETPSVQETTPVEEGTTSIKPVIEKMGWYMRIAAKAEKADGTVYEHNTAGVFGELSDSENGLDKHDIPSYGKAVFQVKLVNAALSLDESYFSDYRKLDENDSKQIWTFQVRNEYGTDLSDAVLTLNILPMKDVFKREGDVRFIEKTASQEDDKRKQLSLIDLDDFRVYPYSSIEKLRLSMNGKHVRNFRLVLGEVEDKDMIRSFPLVEPKSFKEIKASSPNGFGLPPE